MRSWWRLLVLDKKINHFKFVLFFLFVYFIISGTFIYVKSSNEISTDKNIDVCLHGLLYDARLIKKEKIRYLDSAVIEIYDVNKTIQLNKLFTNKAGAFFTKIPLQNKFQIKLYKQGWFARKIIIDTNVPENCMRQFHLFIDAELFKELKDVAINENDFPVLEIYFDKDEKRFISYLENNKNFNRKLKKSFY